MDFLKDLFGEEALTWAQFSAKVTSGGFKIADLSKGDYVASKKYHDELDAKETTIAELNKQIKNRDNDIKDLQTKLQDGSVDSETKISDLTQQLTKLQGDYDTVKKDYSEKLNKQAYEFAVKEFANDKKFTSNAAKRDFINEMISENLKMKDNKILGADDFMSAYKEANTDAFLVEQEVIDEPPAPEVPKPSFGQPTPPTPAADENGFLNAFNFSGVRAHD